MWLLPPDFPLRPLRLAPDRRALPWYATDREVEQLMELLRRMVPEIKEWVRVPWAALDRVSSQNEVREGAALVLEAPKELEEAEARAIVAGLRWPYVFWRPREPSEEQGAWLEREVKRALLSELRQGLMSEEHPLREVGIERLPVDLAATATDDPVDLLAIVQSAVTHRLEHADEGTRAEDWSYSVRRAIGEQLAMRLGRLEGEALTRVLELVLSEGKRRQGDEKGIEARQRIQEIGLGVRVGDDVALSPLARRANDPVIHGVLLERLPTELWPRDGRRFLRSASHESTTTASLPPTRIAGPMVIHYPKLVLDTLARLEEVAKALPIGGDAALATLRAAWLRPLFLNQWNIPELGRLGDEQAQSHRLLDQVKFEDEEHRAFVALLRALNDTSFAEATLDVLAHLRRLENQVKAFDASSGETRRRYGVVAGVELFGAIVLLGTCQGRQRLQKLRRHIDAKWELARHHGNRDAGEEKSWQALRAEAYRLSGQSAVAARLHQRAGFLHPDMYPEGHGRRSWELARAIREAGYEARAHEILIRLEMGPRHGELVSLKPDALLELGHIELERGSLAKAREHYREVRESSSGGPLSRQARYAEVYDGVVGLVEGTTSSGLESRLLEIAGEADVLGDLRLSMLVDLVIGDLWLQTNRFDGARKRYFAAREKAQQLGDLLATACAFEKTARLDEALDRKQDGLAALLRGSELDVATEHHIAAERQLRHAVELAVEQDLSEQADELRARALEQQRAAELHEVDNFTLAKREEAAREASAELPLAAPSNAADPSSEETPPSEPSSE